jgi:hypothetical protein
MNKNSILVICLLMLAQITFIYAFEDFSLIRTRTNLKTDDLKSTKSFLQKKQVPTTDSNKTIVFSNSTNVNLSDIHVNKTEINLNHTTVDILKAHAKNSSIYLCNEIKRVLLHLVDLDNGISELRESFNNHTKPFVFLSDSKNFTEEGKKTFVEKENKNVMVYINKINEMNSHLQTFRTKLMKLSKTKKCGQIDNSLNFRLQSTTKNLNSLIQLISEEVKEYNLPVNFIAITNQ